MAPICPRRTPASTAGPPIRPGCTTTGWTGRTISPPTGRRRNGCWRSPPGSGSRQTASTQPGGRPEVDAGWDPDPVDHVAGDRPGACGSVVGLGCYHNLNRPHPRGAGPLRDKPWSERAAITPQNDHAAPEAAEDHRPGAGVRGGATGRRAGPLLLVVAVDGVFDGCP